MSTPLTDSINALTSYANEVTGKHDTTLSGAVHTLANGYSGGKDTGNIKALIVNGGEYINTELYPDSTVFYIIDAKITTFVENAHLFGTTYNSNRILCQMILNESDGLVVSSWTRMDYSRSESKVAIGERFITCISGGFAKYNGVEQTETIKATSPLYLFRGYWDGSAEYPTIKCEFYGMKIVKTDTLKVIHNYVPWLENETPCIKDTITGDLLYNAGSGTFGYIDLNDVTH